MSFCLEIEANLTIVSILFHLENPTVISMTFCLEIETNLTIVSILFYLGNPTAVSMTFFLGIEENLYHSFNPFPSQKSNRCFNELLS